MTWLTWSLLSALFAALTAILAKIGIAGIDPNLATAIRTSVVVVFTWLLAFAGNQPFEFQAQVPQGVAVGVALIILFGFSFWASA
jgi:uncharacterized membrane protein